MALDPLLMAGYELAKEACRGRGYWGTEACIRKTMREFKRTTEMLRTAVSVLGL